MLYTLNKVERALPSFSDTLKKAVSGEVLSHDSIVSLLQTRNKGEIHELHEAAGKITSKVFGNEVSIRGIVEFSNHCEKACHYCGVPSYTEKGFLIPHDSIIECCDFMWEKGYRNLVLQSGEVTSEARMNWLTELVNKIFGKFGKEKDTGMCIILSIGELSYQQYKRLYDLGVQRFLLRVETSNPSLYAQIHPPDHKWERRIEALRDLKSIGYVTGTGSMVGLPNQTFDDVASDIEFFRNGQYPMIGLGPYVIHSDTVMGKSIIKTTSKDERKEADDLKVETTLKVYDVLRLVSPLINLAATTALDTLSPGAKAIALTGGSNVVMPIITPKVFRSGYQLYEGKKEVDMDRDDTHQKVLDLMKKTGKTARFNRWNHPPLFEKLNPNYSERFLTK